VEAPELSYLPNAIEATRDPPTFLRFTFRTPTFLGLVRQPRNHVPSEHHTAALLNNKTAFLQQLA
jgi:hypothetical protein